MSDGAESDPVHDDALQVGAWRVEFPLHRLASGDRIVKLEPKSTALLRYLAERPGQVVSRELLLSAVWPGVVVGDDSLTQAMIKLRKALGDGADTQSYIETIPKGGYRLVAPVRKPEPARAAPAQTAGATSARESFAAATPPGRRKAALATAALGAAVALSLLAAWLGWVGYDGLSQRMRPRASKQPARRNPPSASRPSRRSATMPRPCCLRAASPRI